MLYSFFTVSSAYHVVDTSKSGYICPNDIVTFYCYGDETTLVWLKDSNTLSDNNDPKYLYITRPTTSSVDSALTFTNLSNESSLNIKCSDYNNGVQTNVTILKGNFIF